MQHFSQIVPRVCTSVLFIIIAIVIVSVIVCYYYYSIIFYYCCITVYLTVIIILVLVFCCILLFIDLCTLNCNTKLSRFYYLFLLYRSSAEKLMVAMLLRIIILRSTYVLGASSSKYTNFSD